VDPEPILIEPIFSPRLWGSQSLAPLYPEKSNLAEPLGEAWLTGIDCKIASGPQKGKTLGHAWSEMSAEWRGKRLAACRHFPILVKFIFPQDQLSIQVHPDDAYAAAHEQTAGGRGKTEMWHAIAARPGAQLLLGLKPGVDKNQFRAALAANDLEKLFLSHPVSAGDTFFVPAGIAHTIGPGMIVFEVQEYSDLTYRVYDYGRVDAHGNPRELHIEKALDVMNFNAPSPTKVPSLSLPAGNIQKNLLAACSYFATERWEFNNSASLEPSPEHFDLLVILSGQGSIQTHNVSLPYKTGQCWFIPACCAKFSLHLQQPTSLIRTYVPDLSSLRDKIISSTSPSAAAQTVFD
jgi:mannose-6-phosphate isomerase